MEKYIGIAGISGKIGSCLSVLLAEKHKVLGGARSIAEKTEEGNIVKCHLDIYDDDSLRSFCMKCSVVVNCTGPSYVIKDRILKICAEYGVKYADLSGDMITDSDYRKQYDNCGVSCLVGTGFVAGLSGVLPLYYSGKFFDSVSSVVCFQGSREPASRNSITDIILSSVADSGHPGCFYQEGSIVPYAETNNRKQEVTGFPEPVYLKAYISNEMQQSAETGGFEKLVWFNASPDDEIAAIASDMFSGSDNTVIDADSQKVENYLRVFNAIADTRPHWNILAYEMTGKKNDCDITKRIICRIKNGYMVCAAMASLAVEALLSKDITGVHWGFEAVSGEKAVELLYSTGAVEEITVNDVYPEDDMEEDVI